MANQDIIFTPDPDQDSISSDVAAFNEVYTRFFAKPWPVRAAVGVAALAVEGMRVEVTAMAARA